MKGSAGSIFAGIIIAVITITGLMRISMNVDVLQMLPGNLREASGLQLFAKYFARPDELILTVETDSPETATAAAGALSIPPHLGTLFTPSLEEQSPEDTAELLAWLALNQDPKTFDRLFERLKNPEATLADTLDQLTNSMEIENVMVLGYDPYQLSIDILSELNFLTQALPAPKDGFEVLYLHHPEAAEMHYKDLRTWIHQIQNSLLPSDGVHIGLTGEPLFVSEIANGMERDMKFSGIVTSLIIAIIFLLCYRRLPPLLHLIGLLLLTFVITLGIAGWVLKDMTVISVGFASILIGLSVDYGILVYQSFVNGAQSAKEARRLTGRGILWASLTTAGAFAALSVSAFPGIADLGKLVGIGILIGAAVMLFLYTRLLKPLSSPARDTVLQTLLNKPRTHPFMIGIAGAVLLVAILSLGINGLPKLETSSAPLRPQNSEAYATLERISEHTSNASSVNVILHGKTPDVLPLTKKLENFANEHENIVQVEFPELLVSQPNHQRQNLKRAASLIDHRGSFRESAVSAGFSEETLVLLHGVLDHWKTWNQAPSFPLPMESTFGNWLRNRYSPNISEGSVLLGNITLRDPNEKHITVSELLDFDPGISVADWDSLTKALNKAIPYQMMMVLITLGVAVLLLMLFAFRNLRDIALVLLILILNLITLLGLMQIFGLKWNVMNLAALPLLLGAGLDYSIHVLLGLKDASIENVRRHTIHALFICGISTIVGFGSLGFASNQGLASLGVICALALALNILFSLFLLPALARKPCTVSNLKEPQ